MIRNGFKISSVLILSILLQIALISGESNKNTSFTSVDDFKKKIHEFIDVNGGLESLGRAAGNAFQDLYSNYAGSDGYPNRQEDFFQNYGQSQTQGFNHCNGHQCNNGLGQQGYYGQGSTDYDQGYYGQVYGQNGNNYQGQLNYGYDQGYYGQYGGYGQQNYGHNQGYTQQNYGHNQGYTQQNYGHNQGYTQQNYGYDQSNGYGQVGANGFINTPGGYPVRRYPPYPYPRPQNYRQGFMDALQSITRHDDLRCVPRLLCEVASAGKAGSGSQSTIASYVNKDSLISLLTVLNFVDDSPIMTFGRAALLGYTARGDNRACIQAYPTCPRDPDRLIDYLNNHNGGFFRFFGGAPGQNVPLSQSGYHRLHSENKIKFHHSQSQYSPGYNQYRIVTQPGIYSILSTDSDHNQDFDEFKFTSSTRGGKKLSFPIDQQTLFQQPFKIQQNRPLKYDSLYSHDTSINTANDQVYQRPAVQFFPDRTGTGDLLLDNDHIYFHTRPTYYYKRDHKQIHFPESNGIADYHNSIYPFGKS